MNSYTNKFTPQQADKIRKFFELDNATFSPLQYAKWQAKGENYVANLYNTGKLLIQGKNTDSVVLSFEKYMGIEKTEQTVLFKNQENDINFEEYVGTDESGKGDFFGPLVIAGVYVNKELSIKFQDLGIKDSKKLDDKTIIKLAAHIKNSAPHSIVTIMPEKYNSLYTSIKNLNKLLAWGHSRAIENVLMKQNCEYALSDKFGDESLIKNALLEKGKKIRLEQRVRGESYIGVAAASVVARAEFVLKSEDLAQRYKMIFPKGANDKVIETARLFIEKYGRENLKYVAKLHFKTTNYL